MSWKKFLSAGLIALFCAGPAFANLNVDRLSDEDIVKVKAVVKKLMPLIQERDKSKDLAKLTFEELYTPLNEEEQAFLKQFQNLDPNKLKIKIPFRGFATGKEDLKLIVGQKVKVVGEHKQYTKKEYRELPPQFLPPNVYAAYDEMMKAMEQDIGKRLYIESGYRSSAYQLYLFVFYLSNHKYSIDETRKFVALPGYSEHGAPKFQAIDFINKDGINGEDNTAEFDVLPEFAWLQKNARRFHFVLSYPKNAPFGITYEPWHWRYEGK